MSDPISSHCRPRSDTFIPTAASQLPLPQGQYQQFTAQPLLSASQQMPTAAASNDNGEQSRLRERGVRPAIQDDFMSDQKSRIKTSTERLKASQRLLEAHRNRFLALAIGGAGERPTQKTTVASSSESVPDTNTQVHKQLTSSTQIVSGADVRAAADQTMAAAGQDVPVSLGTTSLSQQAIHDSKQLASSITSQTESVSDDTAALQQTAQTTTSAEQLRSDDLAEAGVSQKTNDTGQKLDTLTGAIPEVTGQVRSDDNVADTKLATTSVTTKTVIAATTAHDRTDPTSAVDANPLFKSPPRQDETASAAAPDDLPRTESQASLTTVDQGSVSSEESVDYRMTTTTIGDSGAPASTVRSRQVAIFYGDKNKVYCQVAMADGSGLDKLEDRVATEIDNFRKDKKRKAKNRKMTVEVSSRYKRGWEEKSPIYISHVELAPQGLVKRQPRTPAAEIAREITGILEIKEKEKDAADQSVGKQIRSSETRDDLTKVDQPEEGKTKVD